LAAPDTEIFERARDSNDVLVTKDKDFLKLNRAYGHPPFLVFVSLGNKRNAELFAELLPFLPLLPSAIKTALEVGIARI
jgi:predicted nuclease of predicted toxin-antitoxin system